MLVLSPRETLIYGAATAVFVSFFAAGIYVTDKWFDFWSLLGSGASIFGILVAIEQTLQTKSAAFLSAISVSKVTRKMRLEYYRFSLFDARRLFGEALVFIHSRKWDRASLRLRDVADRFSQLACVGPEVDEGWEELTRSIRWWETVFANGRTDRAIVYDQISWANLSVFIHKKIDQECGPFESENLGE